MSLSYNTATSKHSLFDVEVNLYVSLSKSSVKTGTHRYKFIKIKAGNIVQKKIYSYSNSCFKFQKACRK